MYQRILKKEIEQWINKEKIIILYGARQVGKTTLVKEIAKNYGEQAEYFNCDLIRNRELFEKEDEIAFKKAFGSRKLIIIDEAQRVRNIGLNLKIIHDHLPEIQVIATGSSSFDLSNQINEPLTGRAIEFMLSPLAAEEILQKYTKTDMISQLANILRFGLYPAIFEKEDNIAIENLDMLSSNYLYKDILEFESLKKSDQLFNILRLLAFQIGNLVSYHEIGQKLGLSSPTVEKYIELLEKSFIIYRLHGFSKNLRNEIGKSIKIYFWDLGIRNSLIQNYNDLDFRNDQGVLFENFCITERLKQQNNQRLKANNYFWRTYNQKEIDYLEEAAGQLKAFEFKWTQGKYTPPREFLESYQDSTVELINKENYLDFIT